MAVVTMKNLLESGVHFGHQTKRWDPRMKKFIFAERNGIHIIDLQKTITAIKDAYEFIRSTVKDGKSVLFIGTKKQAQMAVEKEATRCNMYYVNNRWLGGMLTNFATIKKSINRLKKIEKMEIDGTFESLTKKEVALLQKEKAKLDKNLAGIKEMKDLPGVIFIIDTKKEAIAVAEARKCHTGVLVCQLPCAPCTVGPAAVVRVAAAVTVNRCAGTFVIEFVQALLLSFFRLTSCFFFRFFRGDTCCFLFFCDTSCFFFSGADDFFRCLDRDGQISGCLVSFQIDDGVGDDIVAVF